MTDIKMPGPVAYAHFAENGNIRIWADYRLPKLHGQPAEELITTTQAQAYADERVREANQWVSVNDRLPNDGDSVMFVVDCRHPSWEHLHGKVLGGTFREGITGGFGVPGLSMSATHWMPLPPPPKQSTPA